MIAVPPELRKVKRVPGLKGLNQKAIENEFEENDKPPLLQILALGLKKRPYSSTLNTLLSLN